MGSRVEVSDYTAYGIEISVWGAGVRLGPGRYAAEGQELHFWSDFWYLVLRVWGVGVQAWCEADEGIEGLGFRVQVSELIF